MATTVACQQVPVDPHSHGRGSRFDLGLLEIHIWSARLDRPREVSGALAEVLSSDEVDRADRFRFSRDADRYVVGRALLRGLLGRYLGAAPESIRLSYSRYGKPELEDGSSSLSFNLSHSDDLAVYAFCRGSEIGVDVERGRADPARETFPEHFFAAGEVATLRALPVELQTRAFLTCWTRKEAFLKARGDGLSLPLDQFEVTLAPGDAPALRRTAWSEREASSWTLYDITAGLPGWVGAVAVRSGDWRIRVWPSLKPTTNILSELGKERAA